jgi:hypothetical protein
LICGYVVLPIVVDTYDNAHLSQQPGPGSADLSLGIMFDMASGPLYGLVTVEESLLWLRYGIMNPRIEQSSLAKLLVASIGISVPCEIKLRRSQFDED